MPKINDRVHGPRPLVGEGALFGPPWRGGPWPWQCRQFGCQDWWPRWRRRQQQCWWRHGRRRRQLRRLLRTMRQMWRQPLITVGAKAAGTMRGVPWSSSAGGGCTRCWQHLWWWCRYCWCQWSLLKNGCGGKGRSRVGASGVVELVPQGPDKKMEFAWSSNLWIQRFSMEVVSNSVSGESSHWDAPPSPSSSERRSRLLIAILYEVNWSTK